MFESLSQAARRHELNIIREDVFGDGVIESDVPEVVYGIVGLHDKQHRRS